MFYMFHSNNPSLGDINSSNLFLFPPPPILSGKFFVTTGWIVLKIQYMVDMDLKLCKRVLKCLTLRLGHGLLNFVETIFLTFLAHLSRRLIGELIVYQ